MWSDAHHAQELLSQPCGIETPVADDIVVSSDSSNASRAVSVPVRKFKPSNSLLSTLKANSEDDMVAWLAPPSPLHPN